MSLQHGGLARDLPEDLELDLEIFRQMKGRCGDYQVGGDLRWGITANMGGNDKTVVCGIYRNL